MVGEGYSSELSESLSRKGPRRPHPLTSAAMVGVILIIVTLVIAIPVSVLMSGGVASALLGYFLKDEAETAHEGSELLETNF